MSKINVLHSTVYNRIAAGEVVERPYAVVKELIENAIDANATTIEIKINKSGIEKIEITDDGSGIEKDELEKVFLPHATSKISGVDDLYSIKTLGFRGEAMASIASVSKMKVASKPLTQSEGYFLESDGGFLGEVGICGLNNGTDVTVDNLFYNTPARAKFLKSDKSELNDISNVVSHAIIGNPLISFKLYVDDKLTLQSFGAGLEDAIISVYGAESIRNSFYIDTIKNGIRINGYLSKHDFTKPNKSYQSLFINGRYVVNNTINAAITNAYSSYLMKRQYPFYCLNMQVPYDVVDVNVHPNKIDVRFSDNQVVYASVYSVVSAVLDGTSKAINIIKTNSETKDGNNNLQNDFAIDNSCNNAVENQKKDEPLQKEKRNHAPFPYKDYVIEPTILKFCDHTYIDKDAPVNQKIYDENKKYLEKISKENNDFDLKNNDIVENELTEDINNKIQQKFDFKEIAFVGQVFNTYLLYEIADDLFLIDQHAAHERILYDKLIREKNSKHINKQPMLLPFVLNVNYSEYNFLLDKKDLLKEIGIELEEFGGNTFKVSEIPSSLLDIDLSKFFNDLLSDFNTINKASVNILQDKIAQTACKAAVKGGSKLSDNEVNELFKSLNGNLGLKCPHGRPIAVKITKYELEKWFKRIV